MIHEIGNGRVSIAVKSLGAELTSLRTPDGHEYLWQGSEDSWTGQSPVLFPVIGGLPGGSYTWKGREYSMGNHGFARKAEWTLLEDESGDDRLVFEIGDDAVSREQYPFSFRFRITYELEGAGFSLSYRISNTGDGVMPFSVGGHPAFACPLDEGGSFEDGRLRFDHPEDTVRYLKEDNLLTGETEPFVLPDGILELKREMFAGGAIILRNPASSSVVLEGGAGARSVRVDFADFPDLGIWTHQSGLGDFICIEPWFGVDSTAGVPGDGDFETKSGMVMLESGGEFNAGFRVEVS